MFNKKILALADSVLAHIALSAAIGLLFVGTIVVQWFLVSDVLAGMFGAVTDLQTGKLLGILMVVIVLGACLTWLAEIAAQWTAQRAKESLRLRLIEKLMTLGPAYVARVKVGEVQDIVTSGVEALEVYFSRYLPAVIVAILGPVIVLAVIGLFDPLSAWILTGFVVAMPLSGMLWLAWRMGKSIETFSALSAFGAFFLDSLQGIVTLKAFNAIGRRRAELASHASHLRSESMNELRVTLARDGITSLMMQGGVGTVLVLGAWRVSTGELAVPSLLLLLFLAREAFRPIERMDAALHAAFAGMGAGRKMLAFLAEPVLPAAALEGPPVLPPRTEVTFDKVNFSYPESDGKTLEDISFSVKPGELLAVVGPSGAGKSTLVSLLLRFMDVQSGTILVGGRDIRSMPLNALRQQIALVPQETYLFAGTIRDNLLMARPQASFDEVVAAARAASIHDFISGLPHGYDSRIGERGDLLSGGQRQRMAIARALLKDAPVLILDEATSSVDAASEQAIQNALETLLEGRAAIVIAHRLSTIRKADRIIVMDEGRIVEAGTHEVLLSQSGLYARLIASQGERA